MKITRSVIQIDGTEEFSPALLEGRPHLLIKGGDLNTVEFTWKALDRIVAARAELLARVESMPSGRDKEAARRCLRKRPGS